jgi:hypothetical protein
LLASSHVDQVSLECAGSRVPISLLGLLEGNQVKSWGPLMRRVSWC